MKYCAKCKVTVTGAGTRCPLCQGGLQENGEPDVRGAIFPNIPDTLHKHSLFFRILILVSVAAVVICGVINLILPEHGWWSLFVFAGLLSLWADFAMLYRKRRNPAKNILWQVENLMFSCKIINFAFEPTSVVGSAQDGSASRFVKLGDN